MIKDIVVNLTPGPGDDPACRYAISLAETFNAHVTGVAFAYDPPWPPAITDLGGAAILRSLLEKSRADARCHGRAVRGGREALPAFRAGADP